MFSPLDRYCMVRNMCYTEYILLVGLLRKLWFIDATYDNQVMGNLLWSGATFQVFYYYNLFLLYVVWNVQCTAVGFWQMIRVVRGFLYLPLIYFIRVAMVLSSSLICIFYNCVTTGPLPASSRSSDIVVLYLMFDGVQPKTPPFSMHNFIWIN